MIHEFLTPLYVTHTRNSSAPLREDKGLGRLNNLARVCGFEVVGLWVKFLLTPELVLVADFTTTGLRGWENIRGQFSVLVGTGSKDWMSELVLTQVLVMGFLLPLHEQ